jgi:tetratricopeptide (TPR) repeat protein
MQSSYESAIESCDAALNYFPGDVDILGMKVSPCMALKRYQDVLECADSALAKLPQDSYDLFAQFYAYKGDAYYGLNDMENTANMYEKSLQYNPDDTMVMNNYAYYLSEGSDNLEKAEDMSYRTVIDSPENPTYLDTYAWIKFLKIEYLEARNIIDYTLEIGGDSSAEILHHAGDIYFMCGDPDKALEFWNKALAIMPDDKLLQKKVKYKTFFYK